MVKRFLVLAALLVTSLPVPPSASAGAAPVRPVRTMYRDALAREQAVRGALDAPDALATILVDVRALVTEYESIVRHYPGSGYSDNALWNAARLEVDAFAKFGQSQDKDTAVRLLKRLSDGYPSSKLVKQVPEQLAKLADGSPERAAPRTPVPAPTLATTQEPVAQGLSPAPAKILTIRDIRRAVLPQIVRVTIELDGEPAFHDEHIADPDRVFVDLAATRAAPGLVDKTLRFESDADVVRQVRIGRHPNNTTRVVLDTTGVGSYTVYPLESPSRLVIDCVRATKTTIPAVSAKMMLVERPMPLLLARTITKDWVRTLPSVAPRSTSAIAEAVVAAPVPTAMTNAPAPSVAVSTPPARSANGGMTMARQLGLGVSRIVIDPGHGGHDPGAKGRGVNEAELVLDVALRLEKLLQKAGVEVILTRRTDDFVPLQERAAIANREGADLFLSIHANASPNGSARGIETYFLNFANNPNAAQVAARENAASALSMGTLPDVVKAIALNNKVDESRDFAGHVQHAMIDRLRTTNKSVKDLGVKQAPFIVLLGATMPSVLAEISFVTNPQEARLLKGNAYRQKIAEALFNAIRRYQTSLKTVQTVAHQ